MKHTVTICITVLLLAFGGGFLAQQDIILRNNIAKGTFAKDHSYYELEQNKFNFEVARYTVELQEYFDAKKKSESSETPDVHASPTPPSPPATQGPDLRAEVETNP